MVGLMLPSTSILAVLNIKRYTIYVHNNNTLKGRVDTSFILDFISVLPHFLTCGWGSCWFYFLTCGLGFCWCWTLMWLTEMTRALVSYVMLQNHPCGTSMVLWTLNSWKPFDWLSGIGNTGQWTIPFDVIFIFKLLTYCVTLSKMTGETPEVRSDKRKPRMLLRHRIS